MTNVEFHPAARAELTAATEWYLERSMSAAAEFVREVEHAVQRVRQSPSGIHLLAKAAAGLSYCNSHSISSIASWNAALKSSLLLITAGVLGTGGIANRRGPTRRSS